MSDDDDRAGTHVTISLASGSTTGTRTHLPPSRTAVTTATTATERRRHRRSIVAGSETIAFSELERELHRLERAGRGAPASATPSALDGGGVLMPPLRPPRVPPPAATAVVMDVAGLHRAVRDAIAEAVKAALDGREGVLPAAETLQRLIQHGVGGAPAQQAAGGVTAQEEDAAARTYAALHPAARNLLRAIADVRAKAADVTATFQGYEADAYLKASTYTWESGRWVAEDAAARTRNLEARRAAWHASIRGTVDGKWLEIEGRVAALEAAWNQVVRRYDAILRFACPASPTLHVHHLLAAVPPSTESTEARVTSRVESLRRCMQQFLDTWGQRDTEVRTQCLADGGAGGAGGATREAQVESAISRLHTEADAVERAIANARTSVVEAQKDKLRQLLLHGGGGSGGGGDGGSGGARGEEGLRLANLLAAQDPTEDELQRLYSHREDVRRRLDDADAQLKQQRRTRQSKAASLIAQSHGRWRQAATQALADLAALERDVDLARIQKTQLLQAADKEVGEERERILESARTAFAACESQAAQGLKTAVQDLQTQRALVMQPLTASEEVLANELRALMLTASVGVGVGVGGSGSVPGLAVGMPEPAVHLVASVLSRAAEERFKRKAADLVREHAAALQPVVDGIAAGLPRPASVP